MKHLFFIFLCVTQLISCQNDDSVGLNPQGVEALVAEVGDKKFYESDIDFEILSMPESMRHIMQDRFARGQVLDVMIKREVVAQKAKEMGLDLDPLIAYRMKQAQEMVLIQSVRDFQHQDLKKPTVDEVKAYYKKHRKDFIIPKQIHARHILVSDKQTAIELLKQLKKKPDSFATLAAQFSIDDSTKGRGGDLNWFSKGTMVKAFERAAFALSAKRRLSKPVKSKFGWHIIEWLGDRAQSKPKFEDVQMEVIGILEKEKLSVWIKKLLEEANVEVTKVEYVQSQ